MTKKDFELLANLNKAYTGALEMFGAKNVVNVKDNEIFIADLLDKANEAGLELNFKKRKAEKENSLYPYQAWLTINGVKFTTYISEEELEGYNNGKIY